MHPAKGMGVSERAARDHCASRLPGGARTLSICLFVAAPQSRAPRSLRGCSTADVFVDRGHPQAQR